MLISNEWLKEHRACTEGYKWSQGQEERELKPFLDALVASDHWAWANWVIVRCMDKTQKVKYAIFAAEQVLHLYEAKYPENKAPRKAIEAAKAWVNNPCEETRQAAYATAAYATRNEMRKRILNYGVSLIEGRDK